jgi:hypothetical protein
VPGPPNVLMNTSIAEIVLDSTLMKTKIKRSEL